MDYVKVFSLKDEDNPDYVKTGNEEGKTVETSTLNKTMIAVSDGKYAENGHNTSHIYNAIGSYNYGAMYRLVYGTLLFITPPTIINLCVNYTTVIRVYIHLVA